MGQKKHILAASKNHLLETNISQFVTTGANDYSDMRLWVLVKFYAILRAEEIIGKWMIVQQIEVCKTFSFFLQLYQTPRNVLYVNILLPFTDNFQW